MQVAYSVKYNSFYNILFNRTFCSPAETTVFCTLTPRGVVGSHQRFGETCQSHCDLVLILSSLMTEAVSGVYKVPAGKKAP